MDSFPSDIKKNPKDCMAITLRSGKELQVETEAEKRQTDEEAKNQDQSQTISEERQERTETSDGSKKILKSSLKFKQKK